MCRGGKYTEEDAKTVMIQILNVVAFCHLQGVVHRDLKPEVIKAVYISTYTFNVHCDRNEVYLNSMDQNFLFTSKEDTSQLKAIDFGLSDYVRPGKALRLCAVGIFRFQILETNIF